MALEDSLPLPQGLNVYEHQIGGHGLVYSKKGKVLRGNDNTVFKAVQSFPKGHREIDFYKDIFADTCQDPMLLSLRPFLPAYKGLYYDEDSKIHYFRMEDILTGVKQPSVIDIKMGAVTFEPGASPAKVAQECAKYMYREEVGFLITGIKIYNPKTKETEFFDRFHGRSLNPEQVYSDGIRRFLGKDSHRAAKLARCFLNQIKPLHHWFSTQTRLHFYSSSLLLGYDVPSPMTSSTTNGHDHATDEAVVIRLVDFTHCHDSLGKKDDNFLFGLDKLIGLFKMVITENELLTV